VDAALQVHMKLEAIKYGEIKKGVTKEVVPESQISTNYP